MQGLLQVLRVSWAQVSCPGTEYLLEVRGSIQGDLLSQFHLTSYWTSSTYFEIPLPCGSAYNATVTSRSAAGTSAPSGTVTGTTGADLAEGSLETPAVGGSEDEGRGCKFAEEKGKQIKVNALSL